MRFLVSFPIWNFYRFRIPYALTTIPVYFLWRNIREIQSPGLKCLVTQIRDSFFYDIDLRSTFFNATKNINNKNSMAIYGWL